MITAGIDVGAEYTKAVILKDGKVIGKGLSYSGGADRPDRIAEAYKAALAEANVAEGAVEKITATGKGKFDAQAAGKRISEPVAAAKAARRFRPEASCVISLGADETVVATIGEGYKLDEYAFNQKCTAGLGLFLEYTADRLGMGLDEMGALTETPPLVNEGCVVFSELGVLELLNAGASPQEAAGAAVNAAAVRANSVINDITKPNTDCVVLVGGLARNAAFVRTLSEMSGIAFAIPEDAEYAGAVGAAIPA
jgi:benzoyl-CoA reductase subunit D